jgi:hypothetical protein
LFESYTGLSLKNGPKPHSTTLFHQKNGVVTRDMGFTSLATTQAFYFDVYGTLV